MKVVLATLHAKYVHASLALPCLAAACAGIEGLSVVAREFTVNEPGDVVLRAIVGEQADVVAFSCYIWNIEPILRLASDLKKVQTGVTLILGGPEASYGVFELLQHNPAVDCVIRGEGEETFRDLVTLLARNSECGDAMQRVSAGITFRAGDDIIATPERPPVRDLDSIPSPFAARLTDLTKPLVYYETSRGCPFSCAFCMSSLEKGVRTFSMDRIKADLKLLTDQGVKTIKLVDRTFNFDPDRANLIWQFILGTNRESLFHFEIAADLLTEDNLLLLAQVPPGIFRFEIGVQSGEEETLARVGRRSNLPRLFQNVRRLLETTGVTIHLDLVAGLPHEDYDGFLRSLQSLLVTGAHHIQVEPLKVLKGAPMRRIAREEGYSFSDTPPYKILQTPWLTFPEIGRIEDIARLLDLFYNSGRFKATLAVLAEIAPLSTVFDRLARFREVRGQDASSSLTALFTLLWEFGKEYAAGTDRELLREAICYDYCLAEYPCKLPIFFGGSGPASLEKSELDGIRGRLGIQQGSRVRCFSRTFPRDYRRHPWREGELDLLFVHVSAPGKGLRVEVLAHQAK